MSNFEERLLSALKEEMTMRTAEENMAIQTPVRRGSSRRFVGLGAAVAGVAAAATVAMTVFSGAAPAYAVTKGADGSVNVQINEFSDPDGLKSELAAAGIKSVVDYLPADKICKEPRGEHSASSGRVQTRIGKADKGITFQIEMGQIAADQTLVLAISRDQANPGKPPVSTALQLIKGTVAPCVETAMPALPPPSKDNGPGLTGRKDDSKGSGVSQSSDNQ
jgi:hypothetical protein